MRCSNEGFNKFEEPVHIAAYPWRHIYGNDLGQEPEGARREVTDQHGPYNLFVPYLQLSTGASRKGVRSVANFSSNALAEVCPRYEEC